MNLTKKNFLSNNARLVAFFLLAQTAIFLYLNTRPIYWTHQEMLWHGFFWSMDGVDQFTLHTGFWLDDFLKPFYPYYVEAIFRVRQVSYLADMVSFKFWQLFGEVLFRNYTLILLHVLNVFLVWKIVFHITRRKETAWLSAFVLLNSGIAIATLLFPFRTAKILVMTLFLGAWLMIVCAPGRSPGKFFESPWLYRVGFYLLLLAGLLTDEVSYFLFPFLFVFLVARDGLKNTVTFRSCLELLGFGMAFGFAVVGIYFLVLALPQQYLAWGVMGEAVQALLGYWQNPLAVGRDLANALFRYFLPRNFGFWDFTLLGLIAGAASLTLFASGFLRKSNSRYERWLMSGLVGLILVKALLLPHNSGFHTQIMPPGTVFPSLLFFSYYYTYCEAVLMALWTGLFLNAALARYPRLFPIVMVCVLSLGVSTAVHLKNGPEDTLRFHHLWDPHRQQIAKNVLELETYLHQTRNLPVYASFKSGDLPLARGRLVDEQIIPGRYCQYVLLRYLRDIEAGRLIISLKNIRPSKGLETDELSQANLFVDLARRQVYDLKQLRDDVGAAQMMPTVLTAPRMKSLMVSDTKAQEVVFFIKGRAHFMLEANGSKGVADEQTYGQSYEMFRLKFADAGLSAPILLNLLIAPQEGKTTELVGPFIK